MNLSNALWNNKYLNPDYLFSQMVNFFEKVFSFFKNLNHMGVNLTHTLLFLNTIMFILVVFFLSVSFYSIIRIFEIRKKEHAHLHHEIEEYAHHQEELKKKKQKGDDISKNPRWVKTLSYVMSDNESDWKLAIIEADSLLDDLLEQRGFQGESLGDKLKNATQEKFRKLSAAWDVHNIRNKIAHEGANFEISQHEAKRVIVIYEDIFREYGFI